MPQGTVIATGATQALTTASTANLVTSTYDYIGAGQLKLYARGSVATVLCDLFVQGVQILRRAPVVFFGATGGLDTSSHLVTSVPTLGGRVELYFAASTGTPTVDYLLTYEGVPVVGRVLSKLFGR